MDTASYFQSPASFLTPATICLAVNLGPDENSRDCFCPVARIFTWVPPTSTASTFMMRFPSASCVFVPIEPLSLSYQNVNEQKGRGSGVEGEVPRPLGTRYSFNLPSQAARSWKQSRPTSRSTIAQTTSPLLLEVLPPRHQRRHPLCRTEPVTLRNRPRPVTGFR